MVVIINRVFSLLLSCQGILTKLMLGENSEDLLFILL